MANIIKVDYTYQCPTDNYLDGTITEEINETYEGEEFLFLVVDKVTGEFETVLRDWEVNDGRPCPKMHEFIKLDCKEFPLEAEVLSDYHANHKDDPEYLETPGTKTIPTPDGYEEFEYEYPIHPDDLYDDKRSYYDWQEGRVILVKNTNEDIIGPANDWDTIRKFRNEFLANSDALSYALSVSNPEKAAELEEYRQKLRDLPAELADIDPIFVDSCWPKTNLIEI